MNLLNYLFIILFVCLFVCLFLISSLFILIIYHFLVPPRITVPPVRTSRVDAGQNLTLLCNASGDPRPNITWTREGATQANQLVNATGYRLYLVNVQKEDVGSYRCTAKNEYGTASSLALVNVRCKYSHNLYFYIEEVSL